MDNSNLPAHRLAASRPDQVNNSLASLARQCGVELRVSKDMKAKHQDGAFIGYEPTGKTLAIIDGTPDEIAEMRRRMEGAFSKPEDEQVEMWLAELDLIAPRRASSSTDDDLRMQAYVSRLREYPADVVREALITRTWRFFPSWAELKDVCDEMVQVRRAVRAELDRAEARHQERERRARALSAPPVVLTEEQIAEAARRQEEIKAAAQAVIDSLKAKCAQEDAAERARAEAAAESYKRFRPEGEA